MPYANLSVKLTDRQLAEIQEALTTIRVTLPFLIALTPEERKTILKLGDKSVAFADKALEAARAHPEILPAGFALAEFEKDAALVQQLSQLKSELSSLLEAVDDTLMAAGNETMTHSVTVYSYVKTAARRSPGLRPTLDGLAERWKRLATREKPKPTPSTTP